MAQGGQGRLEVDWSFMKKAHYQVLMEFGLDRDVQLPFIGTPVAGIPASPLQFTPGVASYGTDGNSLPTPPVATDADGITAALEGFKWRHPQDLPLLGPAVARAAQQLTLDRGCRLHP